jgi:hypothetical protein
MDNHSTPQVLCAEYQRLLKESQVALNQWNRGRAEIHNSGRHTRDTDDHLRNLQAKFARAWALLQYHEQDCDVCQVISVIEGTYSRKDPLHQSYHH